MVTQAFLVVFAYQTISAFESVLTGFALKIKGIPGYRSATALSPTVFSASAPRTSSPACAGAGGARSDREKLIPRRCADVGSPCRLSTYQKLFLDSNLAPRLG